MALPLSTSGSCCGHSLNMHSGDGLEGTCLVCSCVGFEPDTEIKMSADELRQCSARHGQKMHLRCQEEVTEMTVHSGMHWAIDLDGQAFRWPELVAMYPFNDEPVGNGSARLAQVGGEHYKKFKIQPWDVVDEYELSFYAGNALKYLLRAGRKGAALEDLRKCRHYLDKLIEVEEARDGG